MSGSPGIPGQQSEENLGNQLQGQTSFRIPQPTSGQFAFEDPTEAAHKRQLELDDAAHARQKELVELQRQGIAQLAVLILLLVVAAACLFVMVKPGYPASTTDKALGILVAIVSGFIGYFTGQATKK